MDCRIPVTTNIDEWSNQINAWYADVGGGVFTTQFRFENANPTDLSETNNYWSCFKQSAHDMGLQIETRLFFGGTDARFLRELGIPAFGFSPICNHPVLLHDTDEYFSRSMFLHGIDVYMRLISALGDSK